nr:unnamed protein product [Digitaria exilis]
MAFLPSRCTVTARTAASAYAWASTPRNLLPGVRRLLRTPALGTPLRPAPARAAPRPSPLLLAADALAGSRPASRTSSAAPSSGAAMTTAP